MQHAPYEIMPPWQRPSSTDYATRAFVGSQRFPSGNRTNEHGHDDRYYSDHHRPYHGEPVKPDWHPYSPSPRRYGERICGAAGTDHDMRTRRAAEREQHHHHANSPRSEHQAHQDHTQSNSSRIARSPSPTGARSSSSGDPQRRNRNLSDQTHLIQRKDGQIREQQNFIDRLTTEKQTLTTSIESLTALRDRLTRQLHEKNDELQRVKCHNSGVLQRDELTVDKDKNLQDADRYIKDLLAQIRKLGSLPVPPPTGSLTEDLDGIEELGARAKSEDNLEALDFPADSGFEGANLATPVERRIQALGATMDENDYMESQQPVISWKHLRDGKDNETSSWSRPVDQTVLWRGVKDDPAFALIGDGPPVSFDVLHQRIHGVASSHVEKDNRYYPHPSAFDPVKERMFDKHEEQPTTWRESGDPQTGESLMPQKARGRSRSLSPRFRGRRDQNQNYRLRGYEPFHSDWPSSERDQGPDRFRKVDHEHENMEATRDADTARKFGASFGNGQQSRKKRKGRKSRRQRKQEKSTRTVAQLVRHPYRPNIANQSSPNRKLPSNESTFLNADETLPNREGTKSDAAGREIHASSAGGGEVLQLSGRTMRGLREADAVLLPAQWLSLDR